MNYFYTKITDKDGYDIHVIFVIDSLANSQNFLKYKDFVGNMYKKIIGTMRYININNKYIHVIGIDVLEKYRGQGIGKSLIKMIIEVANKKQFEKIKLDCINSSISIKHNLFYKCGFKFINEGYPEMEYHVMEPHVMEPRVMEPHVMEPHVMEPHVMESHVMESHKILNPNTVRFDN